MRKSMYVGLAMAVLSFVAFTYITAPVGLPGDNVVMEATWIKTEGQYELTANIVNGDNLRTVDGAVIKVVGLDTTEDGWYSSGVYKQRIYGKILSGNVKAGARIEVYHIIPESSTPTIVVTGVKADLNKYISSTTFNGVKLTKLFSPTSDTFWSVYMVSPTEGWAGCFSIYKWNGLGWFPVPNPPAFNLNLTIDSMYMLTENIGWAVGGEIVKWDGSSWSINSSINENYALSVYSDLQSVYMLSENDGWAVGRIISLSSDNGIENGLVMRWNGSSWAKISTATKPLNSVHMLSSQKGWAVGENGTILMWDGSSWSKISNQTNNNLYSVYMLSENNGWAVGSSGIILNWNGSTWSDVPSPTEKTLYDIHMLTSTEGWAVGSSGTVIQFNKI
ncbi:MAG: hypothetical protein AB1476_03950 [Candidatus Hadarchaeota archaeon]